MAGLATAEDVPYFDGDFWPNTLEEAIAEEEKEKNKEELIECNAVEVEVWSGVCLYIIKVYSFIVYVFTNRNVKGTLHSKLALDFLADLKVCFFWKFLL